MTSASNRLPDVIQETMNDVEQSFLDAPVFGKHQKPNENIDLLDIFILGSNLSWSFRSCRGR